MSTHTFYIKPLPDSVGSWIGCHECEDPEPDTVDYVWRDSDGTVFFDGKDSSELVLFMAHHDAFGLTTTPIPTGMMHRD